jgi:protein-S-isoprenylcysteine O-methyltransferase Ste14
MRKPTAAVGSAALFLLAPGVVVGLIPWLLARWQAREPAGARASAVLGARAGAGGILLVAGLIALVQAFVRFVVEGFGTPAPVAAPDRLIVGGVYRCVRNPMYVAALAAIIGQALLLGRSAAVRRSRLAGRSSVRSLVRGTPTLTRRFGADYEAYRRAVPAWWPRLRPWEPGERDQLGPG